MNKIEFHKDEFGNYGVYQNGKYIDLVIDKTPEGKWEIYSTHREDKEAPQIAVFNTLKDCKNWIIEYYGI